MQIYYDNNANQINVLDERFYESLLNKGVYYPSVTTILEAYYKGYGYYEWLKSVGFSADEIMRKAGVTGSNVHSMIDTYTKGMPISWFSENGKELYTLEEWQMFCKYIDFIEKNNPQVIVNEFSFCNEELGYGGTIDLIAKIGDDIWLIDHKTSNAIHKTHELQIAAYAVAWNKINPLYTITRTGILWLKSSTRGEDKQGKKIQGEGWQLKEFDRNYLDAFELFKHTKAIWNEENPNYKPKNTIYPVFFQKK